MYCICERMTQTGEREHFIKRHAVYTLSNDPLLDPARPSSSPHPSPLVIHSSINFLPFHLLRYLPLLSLFLRTFACPLHISAFLFLSRHPLSFLSQNIFVAQWGSNSLSRITHVYPLSPSPSLSVSRSISPYGACHLTCLQSPLTVRKLIQPVILHAHCS